MSVEDMTTEQRMLIGYQDKESSFEPVPYTIRIPNKWKKVEESSVLSPPSWLLLDHTVAVVWSLFSSYSPPKALDIEDLKWAHEYLKEVRNAKGENPPDVKTCLTEIQDRLIAQYAQLTRKESVSLKKSDLSSPSDNEAIIVVKPAKESTASDQFPQQIANAGEGSPTAKMKNEKHPMKDATKSETQATRKSAIREGVFTRESKKSVVSQPRRLTGAASKSTPIPAKRSEATRKNIKKEDGNAPIENFFTEVFQRNKNNDRILGSHNLTRKKTNAAIRSTLSNEDISESDVKKDSIQSQADDGKISLQFKKWITEEEINNEEQAYRNLKNEIRNLTKNPKISKDEVLKFLSNWREEQVERLQSELKRLNSIEEFMKSFKMEGFVPYVPQNLVQKLESITNKKKSNKLS